MPPWEDLDEALEELGIPSTYETLLAAEPVVAKILAKRREQNRDYMVAYQRSPAGEAAAERWRKSAKGKTAARKYRRQRRSDPVAGLVIRAEQKAWKKTPAGLACARRNRRSPRARATKVAWLEKRAAEQLKTDPAFGIDLYRRYVRKTAEWRSALWESSVLRLVSNAAE